MFDASAFGQIKKDNKTLENNYNPNFATVTGIDPLQIQVDGDSEPLDASVGRYAHVNCVVGDKVKYSKISGFYLVEGVIIV